MTDRKVKLMDIFTEENGSQNEEHSICGIKIGQHEAVAFCDMFQTQGFAILQKILEAIKQSAVNSTVGSYGMEDDKLYQREKARYLLVEELLVLPELMRELASEYAKLKKATDVEKSDNDA
jgi:hypothetical protein